MRLALDLAARGRYFVSPNPMVGAVLVKGNRVVGRGYHRRFGGPHAEVEATLDAGTKARGSVMYVTLEPCCFCGKTGACTDAIEQAGIRQVVAATLDPFARVHGRGMRCLRQAGIRTSVGLLAAESKRLNEAYFTYHTKRRPFVVLKLAATLDGMLATLGGESQWITGPAARKRAQELRCAADAVLVGVNTVLADDPRLTCRAVRGKKLLRVVLDSRLRMPATARVLKGRDPVLVLTTSRNKDKAGRLAERGAEVVRARASRFGVSWSAVMAELHRRKVLLVLVEGGATVASSALEAGAVDKLYVTHAAKVLGPGKVLSACMKPRRLSHAVCLDRVEHEVLGKDVMTSGYVRRR
ncbi:MAG: bifunctional diaminohydroxyphosphoribosylaminopyrimidine deaminase/5-amino-6-(5-phosphoribosylamino)uracil reductase RibD [candidate division WOR-3 bacterium]|nr:MAG: bifunctional diaminohydroxyphosphoribosylaminopyrimidine deaminase/5-amino-6-(5-phosphoribosylamino)uracil reductase RibD [candidate division WOR-3 bacterium]